MRRNRYVKSIILLLMILGLNGCTNANHQVDTKVTNIEEKEEKNQMKIKMTNINYEVVYLLNDSQASKTLYNQLPLEVSLENYSNNEKVFYPPQRLDTNSSLLLEDGDIGTLGYFAPWGNVVMYYGKCNAYAGLYILGEAIEGSEDIKELSGTIKIEKVMY